MCSISPLRADRACCHRLGSSAPSDRHAQFINCRFIPATSPQSLNFSLLCLVTIPSRTIWRICHLNPSLLEDLAHSHDIVGRSHSFSKWTKKKHSWRLLMPPLDIQSRKELCVCMILRRRKARTILTVAMGNFAAFSQAVMYYVVSPRRPPGDVGTHVFLLLNSRQGVVDGMETERSSTWRCQISSGRQGHDTTSQ